ncbi:MAG: hypothetical protein ACLR1T_03795 [Evtepia gabavorous]
MDKSRAGPQGGAGLGLACAKRSPCCTKAASPSSTLGQGTTA